MADEIGALRVEMSANAVVFEKDMGRARRAVSAFSTAMPGLGKQMESAAKAVFSFKSALIAVAGAAALGLVIKRALDLVGELADTAKAIGISVGALQELRYAALQGGLTIEQFDKALSQFSVRIGDAKNGVGTLTSALKDNNPELLQSIKSADSVDEAFNLIADAANNAGSQVERNTILAAAFGTRIGTRFAALVEGGSEAINRFRQEARDLGLVLDEVMIREAEVAGDQLERMGQILSVNLTRALISLSPQIIALGDAFIKHIQPFVEWLERQLPATSSSVNELERRIAALNEAIAQVNNRPGVITASDRLKIQRYNEQIAELNGLLERRKDIEAVLKSQIEATSSAQDEAADSIGKITSELQFELDQIGRTEIGQKLYNLAKKEGIEVNAEFIAQIQPLLAALDAEKQRLSDVEQAQKDAQSASEERARRGTAVTEANRTEQEKYNDTIEELSGLLVDGSIDFDTFSRAGAKAREELENSAVQIKKNDDLAKDLGLTFTSAFEDAVVGGKKFSEILQGIEKDLLRLFLRQQVTKPLLGALEGVFSGGGGLGSLFSGIFGGPGPVGSSPIAGGDVLPQFANGGIHSGGFRLVGERGAELEATGPSRIYSAAQTADMLGGGGEVTVIVNAPPGSAVDTRETTGPGGRTIEVFIDETTAKLIGTPGSRTGRAMRNSFGNLQPQLRGRG
jgi:hypothetical protein